VAVFALTWVGQTLAKDPREVQTADRNQSVRSADGRWLASVRFERTSQGEQKHVISLSDAWTGKVVRQWEREAYKVIVIKFVGFSPDGRLLVAEEFSCGLGRPAVERFAYDLDTGKEVWLYPQGSSR